MATTFYMRYERALRLLAATAPLAGRLQGAVPITVADLVDGVDTRVATAPFELFGPGDVGRLGAGAITRRFPAPGTSDAEETKLALVELAAPDLPWRYTPEQPTGAVLRPWLVLVVGRRAADEITVRPDGRVTLGTTIQAQHPLARSGRWAHVQDGAKAFARILCPTDLAVATDYVACLVPAFDDLGADAWTGARPVTVGCYDQWSFRTGPEGDFPDLAAKLHRADLAAIEAAGGRPFGRADVEYERRVVAEPPSVLLPAAGVLRLPADPAAGPDPVEMPLEPAINAEVAALQERIVTPDGRGVVTLPRYASPFVAPDTPSAPGGWIDQAGSDPRARGAAGIGAWAAIEWQDRIADAAAAKAGDLAIARDRIGHVALGVEVASSLWRRRLPPEPGPAAEPAAVRAAALARLAVLAPALGRLPTDDQSTVLDRITGPGRPLARAMLSSAARRAMRPGPARTTLAQPGAGRPGAALDAANTCREEPPDPAAIQPDDPSFELVLGAVKEAIFTAAGEDPDSASRILERLGEEVPAPARLVAALAALAPGPDGRPDPEAVAEFLDREEWPDLDPGELHALPAFIAEIAPGERCEPLNLDGLCGVVIDAIDPTGVRPPVVDRVLSTLPGVTHIGPVELEPELDLPLWSFVSSRSPDWMLPGAGDLAEHAVVGLSTNPAFVHALLAGANHQATGELRWRNVPLVSRWSPLRKFWQRVGGQLDIAPLRTWPAGAPLGDPALAVTGQGDEAVVALRTPLFRRYPATVVYLYANLGDWNPPHGGAPLLPILRTDPTFTGTIGSDITFFGFPLPASALARHWLVLEEPPAGYRFYHETAIPPPHPGHQDHQSVGYAANRFAPPVRVLIGPLL